MPGTQPRNTANGLRTTWASLLMVLIWAPVRNTASCTAKLFFLALSCWTRLQFRFLGYAAPEVEDPTGPRFQLRTGSDSFMVTFTRTVPKEKWACMSWTIAWNPGCLWPLLLCAFVNIACELGGLEPDTLDYEMAYQKTMCLKAVFNMPRILLGFTSATNQRWQDMSYADSPFRNQHAVYEVLRLTSMELLALINWRGLRLEPRFSSYRWVHPKSALIQLWVVMRVVFLGVQDAHVQRAYAHNLPWRIPQNHLCKTKQKKRFIWNVDAAPYKTVYHGCLCRFQRTCAVWGRTPGAFGRFWGNKAPSVRSDFSLSIWCSCPPYCLEARPHWLTPAATLFTDGLDIKI